MSKNRIDYLLAGIFLGVAFAALIFGKVQL